jgi:hypothetical protein
VDNPQLKMGLSQRMKVSGPQNSIICVYGCRKISFELMKMQRRLLLKLKTTNFSKFETCMYINTACFYMHSVFGAGLRNVKRQLWNTKSRMWKDILASFVEQNYP